MLRDIEVIGKPRDPELAPAQCEAFLISHRVVCGRPAYEKIGGHWRCPDHGGKPQVIRP